MVSGVRFPMQDIGLVDVNGAGTVGAGIRLRDADARLIVVESLDLSGSKSGRGDGKNPRPRSRIDRRPSRRDVLRNIAQHAQAARRGRVIAGSERHSRWNQNGGVSGARLLSGVGIGVGMNREAAADGERLPRTLGIRRPIPGLCRTSAKLTDEFLRRALVTKCFNANAPRSGPADDRDVPMPEKLKPLRPRILPLRRSKPGPTPERM